MDVGTLFTEQRWNILSALSEQKYSPLQLAEKSNTTMANISQQLKLLEFSKLVKKEKISNRDKGKPRSLFSLSDDYAYLVTSMQGYANKKLLKLDKFQTILIKTYFFEEQEIQYPVMKFLIEIQPYLDDINFIGLTQKKDDNSVIKVVMGSEIPKELKKKINDLKINSGKKTINFDIKIASTKEIQSMIIKENFSGDHILLNLIEIQISKKTVRGDR